MVSSLIEVFVRSCDKDIDVGHYREMSLHWQCGLAQWAYGELAAQFKGKILTEDDLNALQQVVELAKNGFHRFRVYDISRLGDRVRALKRGVLKTPTVIADGQRYVGLEEISRAISGKSKPLQFTPAHA